MIWIRFCSICIESLSRVEELEREREEYEYVCSDSVIGVVFECVVYGI